MMGKFWNKFHPLFGADLKVGLETTFRKEVFLDLDPLYEKSGLVHEQPDEIVKRVYEPAVAVRGSCVDGDAAQVFFELALPDGAMFKRLVLVRKIDHHSGKPRRWMIAARHDELLHFGFDSFNSRSERYLYLAYPGLEENFIPVYVKIQEKGGKGGNGGFIYLEVWAWDEDDNVVVQARRVSEQDVPKSLL